MNAQDILLYGNRTLLTSLDGLTTEELEGPEACGIWTVKDVMAHLASYELLLIDILYSFLNITDLPYLEKRKTLGGDFNDSEVEARKGKTAAAVIAEYTSAHKRVMELIPQIPEVKRTQVGTIPWYGPEYALDDLLVYMYYGHKREHAAQINVVRDLVGK